MESALAGIALVVTAPLLLLIGLVVRVETRGPALFRQVRIGRGGQPFEIVKFRTMRAGADGRGLEVTVSGDARVTNVGRFLRRTKLDELPQLLNVVRGEMGIVGPRPEVPRYVALWPPELRHEILSVPPGLTDPATIALRDEEVVLSQQVDPERYYREVLLPRKARMYSSYVRDRNVRGDVLILAKTVRAVVVPRGAAGR